MNQMTNKQTLVELIELNIDLAWNSTSKYVREQCSPIVEYYADQYHLLTGLYYTRVADSLQSTKVGSNNGS